MTPAPESRAVVAGPPLHETTRLQTGMLLSVGLHVFVIFGLGFSMPPPKKMDNIVPRLDVVLVNAKTQSKPEKAEALAQVNLDGGGNIDVAKRLKSPLPPIESAPVTEARIEQRAKKVAPKKAVEKAETEAQKKVEQLEQEAKTLLSRLEPSPLTVPARPLKTEEPEPAPQADTGALLQRSLAIARLEAEIAREWEEYQRRPRRAFLGARVQEYMFARYVEDWRSKVERVGNLNYPQAAREQKIYGSLTLTVAIKADGSVEKVEINRSSGHKILDAAAVRIIELASPFAAFTQDIKTKADILEITRTWTFTRADELISSAGGN
jgi:protein TonB